MESQTKPQWWPPEILINILLKLPVKTLIKLWLVCKQWHATIYPTLSDEYRSSTPKGLICMIQSRHSRIKVSLHELGSMPLHRIMVWSRRTMSIKYPMRGYSGLSSWCNGLLCFSFFSRRVVVCNPTTREFLTLPSPVLTKRKHWRSVAIGYIPHAKAYKVLISTKALQCEVFTLGSDSWRTIGDAPYMLSSHCVCVCGEIYWWTNKDFIISFDVEEEKFGLISLPKDLVDEHDYEFHLSFRSDIVEMEGRLGLMQLMDREKRVVWILKDRKCHEWLRVHTFYCDGYVSHGIATGIQDEMLLSHMASTKLIFCHDLPYEREARIVYKEYGLSLEGKSAYFHVENLVFLKNMGHGI